MKLSMQVDREEDGRWFAYVPELPGVICYGETKAKALQATKALALHRLADMVEHGELESELASVEFARAA